jgi:hypothetical protein
MSSIRQDAHTKFNRLDASLHGPDDQATYMEIAYSTSTVRTRAKQIWKLRVEDQPSGWPSPLVRMRKALYGNYLQRTCDRPDDSASLSRRGSLTGKIFSENLRNFVAQLSVRTAQVHRLDDVRTYHSSHPFEPSACK